MKTNTTEKTETPSHTTLLHERYLELSSGEQAELRRGTIGAPFWRLLGAIGKQDARVQDVRKWQLLVQCLAIAGHSDKRELGKALQKAGYSEARMKRLLEADADLLPGILRRTARQLNSTGEKGNWNIVRRILFDYDGDAEEARLKLAQQYFTHTPDDGTSTDTAHNETSSTDE